MRQLVKIKSYSKCCAFRQILCVWMPMPWTVIGFLVEGHGESQEGED